MSRKSSPKLKLALKQLRKDCEQSLEDVAQGAKTTRGHIWALESGRVKDPGINILMAVADHFGCSVDALVGRTDLTKESRKPPIDLALLSGIERLDNGAKAILLGLVGALTKTGANKAA